MIHFRGLVFLLALGSLFEAPEGLRKAHSLFNTVNPRAPRKVPETENIPDAVKNLDAGKLIRNAARGQRSPGNQSIRERKSLGPESVPSNSNDVCLTPNCITSAAGFMESIDWTVDPCEDFYGFVCGKWIDNAIIPEGSGVHSVMGEMTEHNSYEVHKALLLPKENLPEDEQMAKDFHMSCLDLQTTELLSYEPLLQMFESGVKMSVPMFTYGRQDQDPQDVLEQLLIHFLADTNIFGIDIDRNPHKADEENLILLYQPALLPPQYYDLTMGVEVIQSYENYLLAAALELRNYISLTRLFNIDDATLTSQVSNMVTLEVKIGQVLQEDMEMEDEVRTMTVKELDQLLKSGAEGSSLDIIQALKGAMKKLTGMDVHDHTKVLVPHVHYFSQIGRVLATLPAEDLTNYMLFGQIMKMAPLTTQKMRALKQQFEAEALGSMDNSERWEKCVGMSTFYFGAKVSQLYTKAVHGAKTKKSTLKLIEDLRSSFRQMIDEASWMDSATRKKALLKLSAITGRDGFDEALNDINVSKVYDGLKGVQSTSLLTNVFLLNKFWTEKELKRILKKPTSNDDTHRLGFDTTLVNAMYMPPDNSIWIPLGIQIPPYFQEDRIQALNYGAIGMVLGHELTHGFDNNGAQFDARGNFKNWWTDDTKQAFQEKYQCFIDQYNSYSYPILEEIEGYDGPSNVNGNQTLGENIADNGGIREALRAYHRYLSSKDENDQNNLIDDMDNDVRKNSNKVSSSSKSEPLLPGLNSFDNDQLFFLGYARGWCETKTLGALITQLAIDPHPPAQIRVTAVASNMEEFARAFKCKPKDDMVPETRCRVW